MSLNSNEKVSNPAKKFLEWKGGLGVWEYYDKQKEEKVQIDETIYMVILDELSTVKGWHDESRSSIYANEVKFTKDEELNVRSFKGGEIVKGLYSNIKGSLEGGKYCKSVYAAMLDSKGNVIEMVNFAFKGSSLSAWIDAKVDAKEGKIIVLSKNPTIQTKGATKYYIPEVKATEKRDDILAECKAMDDDLQEFLGRNKEQQEAPQQKEQPVTASAPQEEDLDLPF